MSRTAARLGLVLFGLVAGLVALEVGLRLLGVSWPRMTEHDENRGKAYRPGARWHQREEGEADIVINSAGFRDRERSRVRPAGTVRLAVLGDSFVDALQVPLDSAFTQVMERRLNECRAFGDRPVEVLNFGVSGYGTAQELLTYRHAVRDFKPDIVILAFLTANDVRDNGLALQRVPGRPYFTLAGDSLVLDTGFRKSHARYPAWIRGAGPALLDHSRVAQAANRIRMRARERAQLRRIHEQTDRLGDAPHQELGLDNMVYRTPEHPAWREAWRVTEALVRQLDREVAADGGRLLVATLTSSIQVHPDAEVRRAFQATLGVDSLSYPDARILDLGQESGIPVVTLAPAMAAYARRHHAWLHGFPNTRPGYGHWNGLGHRLAGELLAARVAELFGQMPCPDHVE